MTVDLRGFRPPTPPTPEQELEQLAELYLFLYEVGLRVCAEKHGADCPDKQRVAATEQPAIVGGDPT